MASYAASVLSLDVDSKTAAEATVTKLRQDLGAQPLKLVMVYQSVHHNQQLVLDTLRSLVGSDVTICGCSVQGVTIPGDVREGPYLLGLMGLGGDDVRAAVAFDREVQRDTRAKGRKLGAQLHEKLGEDARVAILLWDPLCGMDVEELLGGIQERFPRPIIGGGAGQPWGKLVRTFQYLDGAVAQHGAILCGLAGPFEALLGLCHGTCPTGVAMTLTKAEGNTLLEFDGRPALSVWREVVGCTTSEIRDQDYVSNWALGVKRSLAEDCYFIRAAFGFDRERGAAIVGAAIPEGSEVMLHHRTVEAVTEGTRAMARDLKRRLGERTPWAVFGFECGARTAPFLGLDATREENRELQAAVAPHAAWLGMSAWGEVAPVGNTPTFHNCTYPLLVLA